MKDANRNTYFILTFTAIILMSLGLVVNNPRLGGGEIGYLIHITFVVIVSLCFLLYPKLENQLFRVFMISSLGIYFYLIFFLYPATGSNFIFLCLFPAFSILFFDRTIFYFSILLNSFLITASFVYILFFDHENLFNHIEVDMIGNALNFIASQLLLYIMFSFSKMRIKRQKEYYENMQQSERLKMTGQLAAAFAHEIRNPLTVVKGFLQLYQNETEISKDVRRNFSLMIEELNTAELVISQFLTIAKPDKEKKLNSMDTKAALEGITELMKSYALLNDNEIHLKAEEHFHIAANMIEFKQLMMNLMKNAIEASERGDYITVTANRKKNNVEIKVIDAGKGMDEEELKALGTPFYSKKSTGTGLGLMICLHIVEKNKGTIHFASKKGKGTTVIVRFPLEHKQSKTESV